MADLAVIIVTWNVRELALNALHSLFADLEVNGPSAEVYVVDSASSDGTPEAIASVFPQVTLIISEENVGFARGNNLALHHIGFGKDHVTGRGEPPVRPSAAEMQDLPKAVYLLNPDTITQPGATRTLYDTLRTTLRLGLVGAQLAHRDGSFQHSAFHFPGLRQLWAEFFPTPGRLIESRFNGRYPRKLYESGKPFAIDFPLGATYMLKREVIEQTAYFDEQFFMYCEEIDWAWRIRKAGWEAQCVPAARVVHLGGQSTAQVRPRSVVDLWTSRLRLYRKHYPAWKAVIARMMVALGMRIRARQARSMTDPDYQALLNAYHAVCQLALKR